VIDDLQKRAEEAEEAENLPAALELWRELVERSGEAFYFLRYGRVARELEMWVEAEDAFTRALRLNPTSPLIKENIGSLWAHRPDKDEAESFQIAKEWFLKALEEERSARVLNRLGAACMALDDETGAREAYEEAIRIDPYYEESLCNLALIVEDSEPENAMTLLERAIDIDPIYLQAHQALGRLYQAQGDFLKAEYHFRRCLEVDPADYWSILYSANLFAVLGRNLEAENLYRDAITLQPEIKGGFEFFAVFLETIGKDTEASEVRAKAKPPE
jgi:tetratricopeptide (TPR) repeat protein